MSLWVLLWACSSPPSSELVSQRRALDAFERADAALSKGQPDVALVELEAALAERPGDPLLLAWSASAIAEQGRLEEAVARLDRVLDARPTFAEARYNRAALLARLGRLDEAGPDLRRALEGGAIAPRDALVDPDFRAHRGHPAFDFLPESALEVTWGELPERAFRGSEVPIEASLSALLDPEDVSIQGVVRGPVQLVSTIEDRMPEEGGTDVLLRWTVRVLGGGEVEVGPLSFRVSGEVSTAPTRRLAGVGPDGEVPPEPSRLDLSTPTVMGRGLQLDRPVRRGDRIVVKTEVTSQVSTVPAQAPLERYERRTRGQPQWVVWVLPASELVVVRGAGGERFRGPPESGPPPSR